MAHQGTIFIIYTFMLALKDYGLCTGESSVRNKAINGLRGGYYSLK